MVQERKGAPAARVLLLVLALGLLTAAAAPALAHRLKVFAAAEGATVSGYAYFPGGGRAAGQTVRVLGPDGTELGTVATDAEGAFTYEAGAQVDHRFVVQTGDGHRGEFVVTAEELAGAGPPVAQEAPAAEPAPVARPEPVSTIDPRVLEDTVARAVARAVNPLRAQIEAYEARVRLHDILGGLGWIAGLAGLGFFVLGRRRKG